MPKVYNINVHLFESPFHPLPLPGEKAYCLVLIRENKYPENPLEIQGREHTDSEVWERIS